jgi:hypothetical protein
LLGWLDKSPAAPAVLPTHAWAVPLQNCFQLNSKASQLQFIETRKQSKKRSFFHSFSSTSVLASQVHPILPSSSLSRLSSTTWKPFRVSSNLILPLTEGVYVWLILICFVNGVRDIPRRMELSLEREISSFIKLFVWLNYARLLISPEFPERILNGNKFLFEPRKWKGER